MFIKNDSSSVREYILLIHKLISQFIVGSNFKQSHVQYFLPYVSSSNLETIEIATQISLILIQKEIVF